MQVKNLVKKVASIYRVARYFDLDKVLSGKKITLKDLKPRPGKKTDMRYFNKVIAYRVQAADKALKDVLSAEKLLDFHRENSNGYLVGMYEENRSQYTEETIYNKFIADTEENLFWLRIKQALKHNSTPMKALRETVKKALEGKSNKELALLYIELGEGDYEVSKFANKLRDVESLREGLLEKLVQEFNLKVPRAPKIKLEKPKKITLNSPEEGGSEGAKAVSQVAPQLAAHLKKLKATKVGDSFTIGKTRYKVTGVETLRNEKVMLAMEGVRGGPMGILLPLTPNEKARALGKGLGGNKSFRLTTLNVIPKIRTEEEEEYGEYESRDAAEPFDERLERLRKVKVGDSLFIGKTKYSVEKATLFENGKLSLDLLGSRGGKSNIFLPDDHRHSAKLVDYNGSNKRIPLHILNVSGARKKRLTKKEKVERSRKLKAMIEKVWLAEVGDILIIDKTEHTILETDISRVTDFKTLTVTEGRKGGKIKVTITENPDHYIKIVDYEGPNREVKWDVIDLKKGSSSTAPKPKTKATKSAAKEISDLLGGTRKIRSLLGVEKFKSLKRKQKQGLGFQFKGKKGKPNSVQILKDMETEEFQVIFQKMKADGKADKRARPKKFEKVSKERLRTLFETQTGVKLP